ncbi:MAG: hypothetical protein BJ554DRAFT_1915 [Olpidium bornovanus]|uniref:Dynamin-type G domain-containing protein n=1 Tax=Olpidium bornovanus TaxID=278681 RepID=A0A8H8DGQ6_9FUNG|nr:MAG: hypothetical protein BJ554DRAFT_1915 [Olpidium bornovanus]
MSIRHRETGMTISPNFSEMILLPSRDYPGIHIGERCFRRILLAISRVPEHPNRCGQTGPEPTTDRFVAVMSGTDEQVIPGNAAAVSSELPFRGLNRFGTAFLSRFQVSKMPCSLLDNITLIDTPGILSGDKQRLDRGYDMTEVLGHFAERADLILCCFDCHKLDISDEFKDALRVLRGSEEKIRVVLNKADAVSGQQLLRVYGALMWSLGRVIQNPEVMFWERPLQCPETKALLEAEQRDLLRDLRELPGNSAVRKLNEIVKRARLAKVHAFIIGHLKVQKGFSFAFCYSINAV